MVDDFEENFDDIMEDFDDVETKEGDEQTMKNNVKEDDIVLSNSNTIKFDFSKASKATKRPERVNLDKQTVTIENAEIDIPDMSTPWEYSKNKVPYKDCLFKVEYDKDGQYEYYSGVKVFLRKDSDGKEGYSEPSIANTGKTQATALKKAYAEFKGKAMEEVSLHEFLNYLLSKPKGIIEWRPFEWDNKITNKNMIAKFV